MHILLFITIKLRSIFAAATASAPAVILLEDIDSFCPKREQASNETERRVVSTLLTLMDGVSSVAKIVVIGTTNRYNIHS